MSTHPNSPTEFEMDDDLFTEPPLVADRMGAYGLTYAGPCVPGSMIANLVHGATWMGRQPNPLIDELELTVIGRHTERTRTWTGERSIEGAIVTTRVVPTSSMSAEMEELVSELSTIARA